MSELPGRIGATAALLKPLAEAIPSLSTAWIKLAGSTRDLLSRRQAGLFRPNAGGIS